jgi:Cu(I)/Ag(I) efflux system protein CusF
MKGKYRLGLLAVIGMVFAAAGQAAADSASAAMQVAAGEAAPASTVSGTGVIQQVKADQGRVKIQHDPIPALEWPAMSMYFRVKDKAVLEGVAAGDKVRFNLEKDAKGMAITRMEKIAK